MTIKRPIEPHPIFQLLTGNLLVDFTGSDNYEQLSRRDARQSVEAWQKAKAFCVNLLDEHYPQWLDDGDDNYSFGEITFDVETQRVTIDITHRVVARTTETKTI